MFRVCANTANDTGKGFAFLCPNGTLFNQEFFVCDWYMNVRCEDSENFYQRNELIGKQMSTASYTDVMQMAQEMMRYPSKIDNNPNRAGDLFPNQPAPLRGQAVKPVLLMPIATFKSASLPKSYNGAVPVNGGSPIVYVNSLGQLSTDKDSGFDPLKSFILRATDSDFETNAPSQITQFVNGVDNSYVFGQNNQGPQRGVNNLSPQIAAGEGGFRRPNQNRAQQQGRLQKPSKQYLPAQAQPRLDGNFMNVKQIYTYPTEQMERDQRNQRNNQNRPQPIVASQQKQAPRKQALQKSQAPRNQVPNQGSSHNQAPQPTCQNPQHNHQQPSHHPQNSQQNKPQGFQSHHGNNNNHNSQPQVSTRQSPGNTVVLDIQGIHTDKTRLIDLIQRLVVPANSNSRIVHAQIIPAIEENQYVLYDPNSQQNQHSNFKRSSNSERSTNKLWSY